MNRIVYGFSKGRNSLKREVINESLEGTEGTLYNNINNNNSLIFTIK